MSHTTNRISTVEFIEAADSNLAERSLSSARQLGGQVYGPNPVWYTAGTAGAGNGVVKACFAPQEVDACIEQTLIPFRERSLPLTWWVGPSSQPANLGARLQAHGFVHNRDMIGMCAEIDQLASPYDNLPEIKIERVTDLQTLAEWQPLCIKGFNQSQANAKESLQLMAKQAFMPNSPWSHYLVRQSGQIVAISSLFVSGNTAGLYNLVTENQERGQGIGAAMTLGTYAIGREMGCRIATLQSTYPNALRLYHRLGFEIYCKFGIYQLTQPKSPAV